MSIKLSRREKVLIFILLVLAITMGGYYFAIKPAMDKNKSIRQEIDAMSFKYDMSLSDYELSKDMEELLITASQEYRDSFINYYDVVNDEDLDDLFTDLALKYKFTPVSIAITRPVLTVVSAYGIAADKTEATANNGILVSTVKQAVTIKANAINNSISKFVDEINAIDGIRVSMVNCEVAGNALEVSFEYKLYMIEK